MTNKEAIEELKKVDTLDMPARLCEAHYMAIKALEQEQKTDVLDKIIDEVCDIDDEIVLNPDSLFERKAYVRLNKVFDIIDKYKAESEDKE